VLASSSGSNPIATGREAARGASHSGRLTERRARRTGTITEPPWRVPPFRDCDVLVAGGGPAGTAAAIAACH